LKHTVPVTIDAHVLQTFLHNLGDSLPKATLRPKLTGAGLGKHPKSWDPYLFMQQL